MQMISFSKIKQWRRCHKAYDYKYNQSLRRKRPAKPLLTGTIIHEMLHARALQQIAPDSKTKPPLAVLRSYEKKYRLLFREEQEMYGLTYISDLRRIYEGYERHWKNDGLVALSTEEPVITDLSSDVRFIGYIDKRMQDREGRVFITDHKNHKNLPGDDDRFSDLQLIFYVWAWNRENKARPVTGVLWDYLKTKPPAIPELLKNGELTKRANIDTDYFTYLATIEEHGLDPKDYREILSALKTRHNNFYKRVFLPAPRKQMIDLVVEDMRSTALQIAALGKSVKDRNMTRDCTWCSYYNLCQAELRGLDSDFVKKTQYIVEEKEDNGDQAEE